MKLSVFLIVLFHLISLSAQKQALHGTFKKFNDKKKLESIKHYDHGKRTGTWIFYRNDSGRLIDIYKDDLIRHSMKIGKTGDTIYQNRYEYTILPDKRVQQMFIYHNHILSYKYLYNYMGKDSIVEKLDSNKTFKVTYDINGTETIANGGENTLIVPGKHVIVENQSVEHVYIEVDVKASFKGGEDSLMMFLSDNLVYPETEQENEVEGMATISFTVEPDGRVSEVKVSRSSGNSSLDREAIRIIKLSNHRWIPGKVNGKPVRSICKVPISFQLED
jgi:TonB family protein